ncbi:MAG TPA: hydrolase 2, exosortase A system-associated [Burkholderiales bacterium]|nr:hydrolase 2, exosortase A system-associated [Burkholderiales bacterium]
MNNGHSGFFLYGGRGRIFCLHHSPAEKSQLIIVAPFAEEMNKSRRMFTLLARELRPRGYGVLVPDLYGTGDSEGDFADSRWEIWQQDLALAARHLRAQGARTISLLGLRLGALLALECACSECVPAKRVVLWQPVVSGNVFMTQFLRLRIAANMAAATEETTQSLRQRLAQGEALEVAGYRLAPELASAIDAASMQSISLPDSLMLHWMEIGSAHSPAGRRIMDGWRKSATVTESLVAGPPFWSTSEITLAPELIEKTVAIFEQG